MGNPLGKIIIRKITDVEEISLAKHVKATARSLLGKKAVGSKNMQLFYSKFDPGGETFFHSHKGESAHFILTGKFLLESEEEERELDPDTAVFIPPRLRHKFKNIGSEEARMISVFSPPEPAYENE